MTHVLSISRDDPIIHLKAYGGVRIKGVDQAEVQCEIDAPQLATLVEEDGHVYITVNSSCQLTVPAASAIQIEKGMGSVKIANVHHQIEIDKVLGNLVLDDIDKAEIGRIGGNFSVRNAIGDVSVDKVGGNLVVLNVASFTAEKVGGNCYAKDVQGKFYLAKVGGKFNGLDLPGETCVEKVGGAFVARNVNLAADLRTGGKIHLVKFYSQKDLDLKAGGQITLVIDEKMDNAEFSLHSGAKSILIKMRGDELNIGDKHYEYVLGDKREQAIDLASGGAISLVEGEDFDEDPVGDLDEFFEYEDSPFSEMIHARVEVATKRADAKLKAAEIRLEHLRERLDKHRGFDVDLSIGEKVVSINGVEKDVEGKYPASPVPPVPPVARPAGKKGATDEERLMILQMLQEKKISVDEAEALFKAMEK